MDAREWNELQLEFCDRLSDEFTALLASSALIKVMMRNRDVLLTDEAAPAYHSLLHCFGSSFERMASGLSRLWDGGTGTIISLPSLVKNYHEHHFLGCPGLASGKPDRLAFDGLFNDPIRARLRVARTELLSHNIRFGHSSDRHKSDISGRKEFDLVNGELLTFCDKTLDLLFSVNDQMTNRQWRGKNDILDMRQEWTDRHLAFLRHFAENIA